MGANRNRVVVMMGRLTNIKPRIGMLAPRIGHSTDAPVQWRRRIQTEQCYPFYYTKRWKHLRWSVLVRDCFTCAMCGRIVADSSQLVCDHVQPHRGDVHRFWSGPFQTLCKPCHDSAKQREEQSRR
jgi:5-methylcytosine-specific restriction endonuclease McrA